MKKKISFFIDSLSYGGAERVTVYLAKYFQTQNIEVEIVTVFSGEQEYKLDKSVRRIVLMSEDNKSSAYKTITRLRRYLKESKPDIIVGMGSSFTTYLVIANSGLKTKIVISERNDPHNFKGKKITQKFAEYFLNHVDGCVFQTETVAEYYRWIISKHAVIPNPIFLDELPEPFSGIRRKKIVNVGRLNKQKNQKLLINSFSNISKKFPDYTLHIFGEGPEREKLEDHIEFKNLERKVFLHGATPNVLEEIKDASIFAFSSDFEGLPNALIESLALGLPTITTDFGGGGARELINHLKNGIIVPINNEARFTEGLEYLINNPALSSTMGDNAKQIRESLDAKRIGKKWLDFLKQIINS